MDFNSCSAKCEALKTFRLLEHGQSGIKHGTFLINIKITEISPCNRPGRRFQFP